ncbi:hypothetical protein [Salipiger aestuarii]|uniref:Integrase-like protein n=1 Tax=Salipiger aestuarii TaxID=568098 RepID=A0A327Y316_9RHOB|nr:hypothetical protein [Salipiger aestuarii]RAK14145.1 hypothetical protein ATI53_102939 [Salipiger aestuarii]
MADESARRFLRDLEHVCPLRIRTVLTDSGKEFTDRLFGPRGRAATGEHEVDTPRAAPAASLHRQIDGMVERFSGQAEEVLQSLRFRSGEDPETPPHRDLWLYTQQRTQSASGSRWR